MCMELIYRNSQSEYMVDFSYLAIDDKIVINKTFNDENEINSFNMGGFFKNHLWLQFRDENENPVLTAVINFDDVEYDFECPKEDWYYNTLQGQLTMLSNDNFSEELIENITDMFNDAVIISGFNDTYIGEIIYNSIDKVKSWNCRTVSFEIHKPEEDYIHVGYDT